MRLLTFVLVAVATSSLGAVPDNVVVVVACRLCRRVSTGACFRNRISVFEQQGRWSGIRFVLSLGLLG